MFKLLFVNKWDTADTAQNTIQSITYTMTTFSITLHEQELDRLFEGHFGMNSTVDLNVNTELVS